MTALPRVLLLIDERGWAFDTIAQAIKKELSHSFSFDIVATSEHPVFDDRDYAIIHVFFETETMHRRFLTGHAKVVKSVYSHYWEQEGLTSQKFYEEFLREADVIAVPNVKLLRTLSTTPARVVLCPEGVDTTAFHPGPARKGPLVVGWAGNPYRSIKRIDWLKRACKDLCELKLATGNLTQEEMVRFYQSVDIVACSSKAEGAPRPVLEGMACGNFPVGFDVGILQEVVTSGVNGLIVRDESVDALRSALRWCTECPDFIREQAPGNALLMQHTRDWRHTTEKIGNVYHALV